VAENSGNRLTTFVPPAPSRAMIAATGPINRWLMLAGTPLLRDVPLLGRLPGFTGLCDVRRIDLPRADEARLASVCGPGKATFIAPNHPEFFTDWMIDKEIVDRVSPMAASWATNGVVNGMGRLMQRFWLANNLIAQIPGNAGDARAHSVAWAKAGHAVLLHPEGAVGWHGDWVAPLLPGTAEMAVEALARGRSEQGDFEAWIAPVVWKLQFLHDAERGLHAECAYVERRLGLTRAGATPAERIFAVYDELLRRDAEGIPLGTEPTFAARHEHLAFELARLLAEAIGADGNAVSPAEALRAARRWQREQGDQGTECFRRVRKLADRLQRVLRIGPFAWESAEMTQEQAAGHLKRLRSDWCAGTLRDGFNRFVPRPVGPRRAIIRVPEPIPVHDFAGDAASLTDILRQRLQEALDGINRRIEGEGGFRRYSNPFFTPDNNVGRSPAPRRQATP
jgi:hypothetical protein